LFVASKRGECRGTGTSIQSAIANKAGISERRSFSDESIMPAASYLDTLNVQQRLAVEHGVRERDCAPRAPLLVIAGAGSGKTNTLAHRVAHLIVNGADPRLTCNQGDCRFVAGGQTVAILQKAGGFAGACAEADLVIVLVPVDASCQVPVIDPARLARDGGHAIWLSHDGVKIESVREGQGARPWVPPPPPGDELDAED